MHLVTPEEFLSLKGKRSDNNNNKDIEIKKFNENFIKNQSLSRIQDEEKWVNLSSHLTPIIHPEKPDIMKIAGDFSLHKREMAGVILKILTQLPHIEVSKSHIFENGNVLGNSYEVVKNLIENEAFTKDKILSVISQDYSPIPDVFHSSIKPRAGVKRRRIESFKTVDSRPRATRRKKSQIFSPAGMRLRSSKTSPKVTPKKSKSVLPKVKPNKRVEAKLVMDEDTDTAFNQFKKSAKAKNIVRKKKRAKKQDGNIPPPGWFGW